MASNAVQDVRDAPTALGDPESVIAEVMCKVC